MSGRTNTLLLLKELKKVAYFVCNLDGIYNSEEDLQKLIEEEDKQALEAERLRLEQEKKEKQKAEELEKLRLEQERKEMQKAQELERYRLEQERKEKAKREAEQTHAVE